jgi:hypothetical protein
MTAHFRASTPSHLTFSLPISSAIYSMETFNTGKQLKRKLRLRIRECYLQSPTRIQGLVLYQRLLFIIYMYYGREVMGSRDIAVDIETGHGLDGECSKPERGNRSFSSLQRTDRLWVPTSGFQRLFTWSQSHRVMKLISLLHLVLRSRIMQYICSPIRPQCFKR